MNEKLAALYKRLRTSKAFLLGLAAFIGTWAALHFLIGFDPEWGALNLILSAEASLSMALFMMLSDRQDQFQREQREQMLHLMEAVHAMLLKMSEEK